MRNSLGRHASATDTADRSEEPLRRGRTPRVAATLYLSRTEAMPRPTSQGESGSAPRKNSVVRVVVDKDNTVRVNFGLFTLTHEPGRPGRDNLAHSLHAVRRILSILRQCCRWPVSVILSGGRTLDGGPLDHASAIHDASHYATVAANIAHAAKLQEVLAVARLLRDRNDAKLCYVAMEDGDEHMIELPEAPGGILHISARASEHLEHCLDRTKGSSCGLFYLTLKAGLTWDEMIDEIEDEIASAGEIPATTVPK